MASASPGQLLSTPADLNLPVIRLELLSFTDSVSDMASRSSMSLISDDESDLAHQIQTPPESCKFLELLSNVLVFDRIQSFLPVTSIVALRKTCRQVRSVMLDYPPHYLDLSPIKSAIIESTGPIDVGGTHWRAERMDEALTEDEFYSGPIRGIFMNLERQRCLYSVSTMVLDGLTVTADVVREIISEDRFNVRIISLRECKQLNQRKLCQVLKYAVRDSRPMGMPKLRGMYVFGPKDAVPVPEEAIGRRRSPTRYPDVRVSETVRQVGARLGEEWNRRSQATLAAEVCDTDIDKWYRCAGRLIEKKPLPEWTEALIACEGIIHFDAVLCRGPRHQPPLQYCETSNFLPAAIATIALGDRGCKECKSCPEGPAVFGQSPPSHIPLLAPPPLHDSTIRAAQMPSTDLGNPYASTILRCIDCLRSRWCERCHDWWCESCFMPGSQPSAPPTDAQAAPGTVSNPSPQIKVHMGLCMEKCLVNDMVLDGSEPQVLPDAELEPWVQGAIALDADKLALTAKNFIYGTAKPAETNIVLLTRMALLHLLATGATIRDGVLGITKQLYTHKASIFLMNFSTLDSGLIWRFCIALAKKMKTKNLHS